VTDDDAVRRELEQVAYADTSSGRGLIAKTTALRALDRIGRRRRRKAPPPMPPDWHPCGQDSVMAELDAPDLEARPGVREQWFKTLWDLGELDDEGRYIGGGDDE
jgi:hypothetical protein